MKLTEIETIKSILKDNNLWAKKKFGQNFLVNEDTLNKIVESAKISEHETVIEIGPGLGTLTVELLKQAKLVLAIEKDQSLVNFLRKEFKPVKNVKIIHADILEWLNTENLRSLGSDGKYKVVANIPYNITSVLIRKFLENNSEQRLTAMILMVQKEVAERICAKAGNSERGMLTVMTEFYADAKIIEIVKKDSFWPVPDVDSAIIEIVPKNDNVLNKKIDQTSFFRIVKIGFSQKRRQIHNTLSAGLRLPKGQLLDILKLAHINPMLRAEDLTMNDWINFYEHYQKFLD
jgi:16S rRNA (adenine1518-N6/adenine1519-N6)-dimethyltransferase